MAHESDDRGQHLVPPHGAKCMSDWNDLSINKVHAPQHLEGGALHRYSIEGCGKLPRHARARS